MKNTYVAEHEESLNNIKDLDMDKKDGVQIKHDAFKILSTSRGRHTQLQTHASRDFCLSKTVRL